MTLTPEQAALVNRAAALLLGTVNAPEQEIYRAARQIVEMVIEAQAAEIAARDELLRLFVGSAYPVSTEINKRGHNWSEAYLDQALAAYRAASNITGEGE